MLAALKKWHGDIALEAHLIGMAYAASDCSEDGWYEGRDISTLEAYGRALAAWLQWKALAQVCARKGHAWLDNSLDVDWQNGAYEMDCERCGEVNRGYWS
jgi:hypothetical protein